LLYTHGSHGATKGLLNCMQWQEGGTGRCAIWSTGGGR
jgi:hypothetical protein